MILVPAHDRVLQTNPKRRPYPAHEECNFFLKHFNSNFSGWSILLYEQAAEFTVDTLWFSKNQFYKIIKTR